MSHYSSVIVGLAAVLGALVYIARLVHRGLVVLDRLVELPEAHAQLVERTDINTAAIDHLTREVSWLRGAMMMRRGRG